MKKIVLLLIPFFGLLAFQACNPDLRSTYKDYLGDGETIYVGKLADVELLPGNKRFVLQGSTRYMNTARKIHITLVDTDYDFLVDVDPSIGHFEYSFDNIPAGNYYVEVTAQDKDGNESIPETYNVDVYDTSSAANFYSKRVVTASFTALAGTMGVFFNNVEEATSVRFVYLDETGKEVVEVLPGNVHDFYMSSWKDQSEVQVFTRILPSAKALDELEMPEAQTFTLPAVPEEMELPRSYWKWPECTSDTWGTQYGGRIETLWDGLYGSSNSGYHSGDNSYAVRGVPHHVTIDLGIRACMTRGRIMFRPNGSWQDWPAKHMEIWAHADGNAADFLEITDKYDTPAGQFESESLAKGWVKIADYWPEEEKLASYKFIDFPIDSKYENLRYLRYRIVEGWKNGGVGAGVYGMATEIWLWGKTTKLLYLEEE